MRGMAPRTGLVLESRRYIDLAPEKGSAFRAILGWKDRIKVGSRDGNTRNLGRRWRAFRISQPNKGHQSDESPCEPIKAAGRFKPRGDCEIGRSCGQKRVRYGKTAPADVAHLIPTSSSLFSSTNASRLKKTLGESLESESERHPVSTYVPFHELRSFDLGLLGDRGQGADRVLVQEEDVYRPVR